MEILQAIMMPMTYKFLVLIPKQTDSYPRFRFSAKKRAADACISENNISFKMYRVFGDV